MKNLCRWMMVGLALLVPRLGWCAWEISPFAGGRVGGSLNLSGLPYSQFELKDSASYGLSVGTDVSRDGAVEVLWSHQGTKLQGRSAINGSMTDITNLAADQVLFNGLYLFSPPEEKLRPFVLAGLGINMLNPAGSYNSTTKFTWALGGGVKYYVTQMLGLRFDARWVPTVSDSNRAVFCQSNGGGQCQVVSNGDLINQFEFTGGLIFRFGRTD